MNVHAEITQSEKPLSEQFRIVAKQFADADAAAKLMEELKTTTLEKRKQNLQDDYGEPVPDNRLEREVKASDDWQEYITEMCGHRAKATKLKVQMEYLRMRFSEWQTLNANSRAERRL